MFVFLCFLNSLNKKDIQESKIAMKKLALNKKKLSFNPFLPGDNKKVAHTLTNLQLSTLFQVF